MRGETELDRSACRHKLIIAMPLSYWVKRFGRAPLNGSLLATPRINKGTFFTHNLLPTDKHSNAFSKLAESGARQARPPGGIRRSSRCL